MRILVHDYAGHTFPIPMSRALAARGHEVAHAFASSLQTPRGDLRRKEGDPPGLEFRELPMDPEYARYKYSFARRRRMEVAYGREVAAFIRSWRPEAVLSGNTPTETQESLVEATVATGGRFFYWLQDFYSLAVDKILRRKIPLLGGFVGAYYRRMDRRHFAKSTAIVAITEDFVPILRDEFGVPPEKTAVIPNWAALEEMPVRPKDNPWSRRHDLSNKFVFLYTGTLGMKHNPSLLSGLAARFAADPDARVVVVSEGIGAEWLKAEAPRSGLANLIVMPYQAIADLPDVLGTGDVLVSVLEPDAGVFSVPSKVLFYLCASRPLLLAVPQENLAARIIRAEKAGLAGPPSAAEDFLARADELRRDPGLRATLGANGRRYAENTFDIGKTTAKFEALLAGRASP